jgi:hypothetical protein
VDIFGEAAIAPNKGIESIVIRVGRSTIVEDGRVVNFLSISGVILIESRQRN